MRHLFLTKDARNLMHFIKQNEIPNDDEMDDIMKSDKIYKERYRDPDKQFTYNKKCA